MEIFKSNKSVLDYIASQSDTYSSEDFEKVESDILSKFSQSSLLNSGEAVDRGGAEGTSWEQLHLERRSQPACWLEDANCKYYLRLVLVHLQIFQIL